ncbi:MAG: hypothetical protein BM485_15525 [Desulfobulbaceae bacterium DB1]|nr:MAG: hypothetical protein BM485_15525 [Desulfobulbaceae bacterium DB1]
MSLPGKQKNSTPYWDHRRGRIFTRKGGIVFGEAVYCHGYDMMKDLVGQTSYFQVLILNATGKLPERRLADWLEALFICLSYPDARIWCNQIGSLGGTLRTSPVAAVCGGILASDSRMYGPGTITSGVDFITHALHQKKSGISTKDIIARHPKRRDDDTPIIAGYARPIINGDERIPAMEQVASQLGFAYGEHLTVAYEIDHVLHVDCGERINLIGYACAFLCDQGFSTATIYSLLSCWVYSGVLACYAEAADQVPESFFPLRCGDIDYQGQPPRSVPDEK